MVSLLGSFGEASPIDTFLLTYPMPTSGNVVDFFKGFPVEQRGEIAQQLIARGVDAKPISSALAWLDAQSRLKANWPKIAGIAAIASATASAYHGYRRNQSIGWAAWWFAMGSIFPVFVPLIAVAQGYAKPLKS